MNLATIFPLWTTRFCSYPRKRQSITAKRLQHAVLFRLKVFIFSQKPYDQRWQRIFKANRERKAKQKIYEDDLLR